MTLDGKQVFDDYAERYDAWYDSANGQALLATEVECIRPLFEPFAKPYLEVGVGPGRFAEALGIEYGLDPSVQALAKAQRRGIKALLATGESIPFGDGHFGAALLAFTLCFVRDPHAVLQEVGRVLVPGGGLVLGLLLRGTPWADLYVRQGAEGHPLYRTAHFYSREEVEALLKQAGFHVRRYRSALFQKPELEKYQEEQPVDSYIPGAGFVGIAAVRAESQS
jgi:ubiquinone/menaquinone biosynthesis C-methylase UbiE